MNIKLMFRPSVLQARRAQAVEQPKLEAVAHERLKTAAAQGCVFTSALVTLEPAFLQSLDRSGPAFDTVGVLASGALDSLRGKQRPRPQQKNSAFVQTVPS